MGQAATRWDELVEVLQGGDIDRLLDMYTDTAVYLEPYNPPHHGNLLIYGPGRYQFVDFVKVGTPLTILVAVVVAAVGAPATATAPPAEPDTGGVWLAGDLHVHTTYSHDSYGGPGDENTGLNEAYTLGNTVDEHFAIAALRGLDYLAITDHNDVRSQGHPAFGANGVIALPGYENSLDGHAQMLGATAVAENDTDGDGDVDASDVDRLARRLRRAGGVFQINHPAEGSTDFPHDIDWGYGRAVVPDAIEVWNISHAYQPPLPSGSSNDDAIRFWESWLDRGHHVAATGGSDNHYKATLAAQGPGQPTTWVFAAERTTQAVLDGLRAGRTFISHQPPTHGGPQLFLEADGDGDGTFEAMVGDTTQRGATVRARVIGAPGAVVRFVTDGGNELGAFTVAGPDDTQSAVVPRAATWVRAEVVVRDGADERAALCDGTFGGETTYCRNRVGVLALTSAIYLPGAPH